MYYTDFFFFSHMRKLYWFCCSQVDLEAFSWVHMLALLQACQ